MARVASGEMVTGRLGGRVYRNIGGEGFVSAAPAPNDPRTQRQMDARARLELTNRLWAELPLDAMDRWRAYAATPKPFPSPKGRKSTTRGDLVFKGLAAKYLQVHGGNVVPTEPPASAFLGDGVVVSASSLPLGRGRGGVEDAAKEPEQSDTGTTPTLPSPKGEAAGVTFSASAPNSPGVVTELLIQRLAARHRMPHPENYRTQRFVAFEAGSLDVTVEVPPGAYACAIRFVRSDTGQETPIVPIGTVDVS